MLSSLTEREQMAVELGLRVKRLYTHHGVNGPRFAELAGVNSWTVELITQGGGHLVEREDLNKVLWALNRLGWISLALLNERFYRLAEKVLPHPKGAPLVVFLHKSTSRTADLHQ